MTVFKGNSATLVFISIESIYSKNIKFFSWFKLWSGLKLSNVFDDADLLPNLFKMHIS